MLRLLLTPLFPKPLKRMGSEGSALSGVQGQSPWPSFTRLPCNMLRAAFTGFCPAVMLFRKLGMARGSAFP